MPDRVALLIDLLFDRTATDDERDDAAMDLGGYDDERALMALVTIASNPSSEDEFILDVCGESIGNILVKQRTFRKEIIDVLAPTAQSEAVAVIKIRRPEWLKLAC